MIFGCANDEQLKFEQEESSWSPCDDCDLNYINQCSSCQFASPSLNDSLNYINDED